MTCSTPHRALVILLVGAFSLSLPPACASHASTAAPALSSEVVFIGDATESTLKTFLETPAETWAWAGGTFDSPAPAAVLPHDEPFLFSWHADPTDTANAGAAAQGQMIYWLVFSSPTHQPLLRVFTTESSYTPDAQAWQKLVTAGEPISLSLTTATFDGALPTPEGGPYRGQLLTFTLD